MTQAAASWRAAYLQGRARRRVLPEPGKLGRLRGIAAGAASASSSAIRLQGGHQSCRLKVVNSAVEKLAAERRSFDRRGRRVVGARVSGFAWKIGEENLRPRSFVNERLVIIPLRGSRTLPGDRCLIQPTSVCAAMSLLRADRRAAGAPSQGSAPACARPARHVLGDRCSSVGNRGASAPDRRASRTGCGLGIRAVSADQPFNARMRERHVRDGLDFLHVEDLEDSAAIVGIDTSGSWSGLTRRSAGGGSASLDRTCGRAPRRPRRRAPRQRPRCDACTGPSRPRPNASAAGPIPHRQQIETPHGCRQARARYRGDRRRQWHGALATAMIARLMGQRGHCWRRSCPRSRHARTSRTARSLSTPIPCRAASRRLPAAGAKVG